jgi:hypothetical protein
MSDEVPLLISGHVQVYSFGKIVPPSDPSFSHFVMKTQAREPVLLTDGFTALSTHKSLAVPLIMEISRSPADPLPKYTITTVDRSVSHSAGTVAKAFDAIRKAVAGSWGSGTHTGTVFGYTDAKIAAALRGLPGGDEAFAAAQVQVAAEKTKRTDAAAARLTSAMATTPAKSANDADAAATDEHIISDDDDALVISLKGAKPALKKPRGKKASAAAATAAIAVPSTTTTPAGKKGKSMSAAPGEAVATPVAGGSAGKGTKKAKAEAAAAPAGGTKGAGKKTTKNVHDTTAATAPDAQPVAEGSSGVCPECNLVLTMPFCAITGKPHAAGAKAPPKARAKRQPTLAEATKVKAPAPPAKPSSKPASKRGSKAPESATASVVAASAPTTPLAKKGRVKRARSSAKVATAAPAGSEQLSAPTAAPVDVLDADAHPEGEEKDEDDEPLVIEMLGPERTAEVALKASPAFGIPVPARKVGKKQRTLDFALIKGEGIADKLAADLAAADAAAAAAAVAAVLAPKEPKKAVPRPLLDKSSAKAAKDQFDAEGGLQGTSPAVQQQIQTAMSTWSKVQQNKFHGFVFEFLGERAKLELAKRNKAQTKVTGAAVKEDGDAEGKAKQTTTPAKPSKAADAVEEA